MRDGEQMKCSLLQFEKLLRELKAAEVKTDGKNVVCQLLLALITTLETIQPDQLTLKYLKKRQLDELVKRTNQTIPASKLLLAGSPASSVSSEVDSDTSVRIVLKILRKNKIRTRRTLES